MDLDEELQIVRLQWHYLAVASSLSQDDLSDLMHAQYQFEIDRARGLPRLKRWERIPERNLHVYEGQSNRVRMRRLLDFVLDSDRVFDIGIGFGYVSGLLMKRGVESYHGIDIERRYLDSTREMCRANHIDETKVVLEHQDVLDLTPDILQRHGTTLVLALEIFEHLDQPEQALGAVARSMQSRCELLFSVPMLGRLESCWGHLSLFDHARLADMCRRVDLRVNHVEAVHNAWVFVLASKGRGSRHRLHQVRRTMPLTDPSQLGQLHEEPSFHNINLAEQVNLESNWTIRSVCEVRRNEDGTIACQVEGLDTPIDQGHQYGGIGFAVLGGLAVLRLEMLLEQLQGMATMYVDGMNDRGERLVRWRALAKDLAQGGLTLVLRPGMNSDGFTCLQSTRPDEISRVELFCDVEGANTVSFTLQRVAIVRLPRGRRQLPRLLPALRGIRRMHRRGE